MKPLSSFLKSSVLLLVAVTSSAQTKIKDGSVTGTSAFAKPGAILDLESNKRALLLPRVELTGTTSWTPLNGVAPTEGGYTVYNTNPAITEGSSAYPALNGGVGEYYWDGVGWVAKKYNAASTYQEPFNVEGTNTKATANTQNIYQNGNLGLGDFSAANPIAKLDVRGAVRTGGNAFTTDNGYYSFPETQHTGVVGINSVAMGYANEASGTNSFASGMNSIAGGNFSAAIGYGNNAGGGAAIAMGAFSTASGNSGAIAMGHNATASGNFSTAIGYYSQATEYQSTAIGHQAGATKDGATAIGLNASASGNTALAIGNYAHAAGGLSTAIGGYSDAIGENSIAIGNNALSNADHSTAIGNNAKAFGELSTAMGSDIKAPSAKETVVGFYNAIQTGDVTGVVLSDALFQVGNGASGTPSNALTVLKNGNTGIGLAGAEASAKPTERLDIGNSDGPVGTGSGGVRIRSINTTAYTGNTATDKMVVADADGILKTVSRGYSTTAAASGETWIDGKKVFRKVYVVTLSAANDAGAITIDPNLGAVLTAEFAMTAQSGIYVRPWISVSSYNPATGLLASNSYNAGGVAFPATFSLVVTYVEP